MLHGAGSWRVRVVCAAAVLALGVAPRRTWAQASSPPAPGGAGSSPDAQAPEGRRTALYREASDAATSGRWAEARDKLRAVLAIRSSPKVWFSLAQAEEQLGQVASAQTDYGRALQGATAAGEGEVVAAAGHAVAAIAARVPHVRIQVSGASIASGAAATLDGQPVAMDALVAVDPGAHRVAVSAPGMRDVTTSVAIGERQQLDVPVRLEVAEAPVGAPVAPRPVGAPVALPPVRSAAGPWRAIGVVAAGAGVVGLAVGAVFGVDSMSKHDSAQKTCPGATCPDAGSASLWHDAVTTGNVSTVAFVIGGAALLGGGILWLTAPRSSAADAQVGLGPGSVQLRGAW